MSLSCQTKQICQKNLKARSEDLPTRSENKVLVAAFTKLKLKVWFHEVLVLRRFIARRGNVRSICCDNGGNFVGAKNELAK